MRRLLGHQLAAQLMAWGDGARAARAMRRPARGASRAPAAAAAAAPRHALQPGPREKKLPRHIVKTRSTANTAPPHLFTLTRRPGGGGGMAARAAAAPPPPPAPVPVPLPLALGAEAVGAGAPSPLLWPPLPLLLTPGGVGPGAPSPLATAAEGWISISPRSRMTAPADRHMWYQAGQASSGGLAAGPRIAARPAVVAAPTCFVWCRAAGRQPIPNPAAATGHPPAPAIEAHPRWCRGARAGRQPNPTLPKPTQACEPSTTTHPRWCRGARAGCGRPARPAPTRRCPAVSEGGMAGSKGQGVRSVVEPGQAGTSTSVPCTNEYGKQREQ